jgi:hypothetical protein
MKDFMAERGDPRRAEANGDFLFVPPMTSMTDDRNEGAPAIFLFKGQYSILICVVPI